MSQSLPKSSFLRKPWQYREVYAKGKRLRGDAFSLIMLPTGRVENRIGISVHGVKQAVRRNRIKRIVREFFRLNRESIGPAVDLVFAVRTDFALDSPQSVARAVNDLLLRQAPGRHGTQESHA